MGIEKNARKDKSSMTPDFWLTSSKILESVSTQKPAQKIYRPSVIKMRQVSMDFTERI